MVKGRQKMAKYKCIISYDGANFAGFQIQPKQRTIQGEIEAALTKMEKRPIRIYSSGRTDTGVHAKGQTFHFESSLTIANEQWKRALNTLLPGDIYVHSVEEVAQTFHARFDAVEKEYRYFVYTSRERDVFKRNYAYHFPHSLNLTAILEGCHHLEGEHDFTTFSSAKATAKGSRVRTLTKVTCQQNEDNFEFIVRGNGFLYHMVRIIVGVLLDIGTGKLLPDNIPKLLAAKDRRLAGDTAPPEGLYLWEVTYE